jgi:hypothetical protein
VACSGKVALDKTTSRYSAHDASHAGPDEGTDFEMPEAKSPTACCTELRVPEYVADKNASFRGERQTQPIDLEGVGLSMIDKQLCRAFLGRWFFMWSWAQ